MANKKILGIIFVVLFLILPIVYFHTTQLRLIAPGIVTGEYASGEILVKFRQGVNEDLVQLVINLIGATQVDQIPQIGVRKLRISEDRLWLGMTVFKLLPIVEYVSPNNTFHLEILSVN